MEYPENIEEIRKFAEKIDLDVKYLLGEKYEGHLNLYSVESLPKNIIFNVGTDLNLSSVKSLPANIIFNVDGWLDLSSVVSLPNNIIFNVDGNLILYSVNYLPSNTIFNVNEKIFFSNAHKVKVIWN